MAFEDINPEILQLLLDDLDHLEDRQKGKHVAGKYTDLEFAISCMREDLVAAQTSVNDAVLALSISTAVATDQMLLNSIKNDEINAEQDHAYALALNNGQQTGPETPAPHATPRVEKDNDDAVSVVLCDLMSRISIRDDIDNGEGPSNTRPRASHSNIPSTTRQCVSCLDEIHTSSYTSPCGHEFCLDCIKAMFLAATKDEELYPPRCCGETVPPGIALRVLNYKELSAFSERGLEWTAKDRLYCADPTCSKFIPPFAIKDEIGVCPDCKKSTHLTCRSLAHPGFDCPMDDALNNVLAMAEDEKWKRCFHCKAMVELRHGCNHIRCLCGREFCYVCGKVWKTCECPLWHENRLIDMANQAVEEELPPEANLLERQNLFDQFVEHLRGHEQVGCEHHRNSQWTWRDRGYLKCELCNHVLPEYIFMCWNCRMRVCNRCRRHRLR